MGIFDFLFGKSSDDIPKQYKQIVNVFKAQIPTDQDEKSVEIYLYNIASRMYGGNKKQQAAANALQKFIKNGGAKYFVKKK